MRSADRTSEELLIALAQLATFDGRQALPYSGPGKLTGQDLPA